MLIFRDLICNLIFFLSLQPKWINQSGTSLALTRIKLAQMDGIEIKAIIKQGENKGNAPAMVKNLINTSNSFGPQ